MNKLLWNILDGGKKPVKKTAGAACFDCYARCKAGAVIANQKTVIIPLGFKMAIPEGYYAEIRPRSGLTSKGIQVMIGTIDSDYRGEVGAIVFNASGTVFNVSDGDRIAQMMIKKIVELPEETVSKLDATERGTGGFGSTGI